MNNEIGGLAQGLNQAIQQYLGTSIQVAQDNRKQQQAWEQKLSFDKIDQENQLVRESALAAYKKTLEGQIDPDTAAQAHPKAADIVRAFEKQNGRLPSVDEADKLFKRLEMDEQKELNRESRINTTILNYTERLEKNPILLKFREQGIAFDTLTELTDLAKSGNTVASASIGTKMAKAMGEVGVLTENDVKRYVQSKQLSRAAGDKLMSWAKGRPTDATLDEIQQINGAFQDIFGKKISPIYDTYINRLSENMGISKEEAAKRLDVPYSGNVKGKGGKVKPTESDPLGLGI